MFESEEGLNFAFYIRKGTNSKIKYTRILSALGFGVLLIQYRSEEILRRVQVISYKQQSCINLMFCIKRLVSW